MKGEKPISTTDTTNPEVARNDFTVTADMIEQLDPGSQEIRDNHIYIKGSKSVYKACWTYKASGELVCHNEVVVADVILSIKDMTGAMWGTFEYIDEAGSVLWKGIFHGNRRLVGGDMISTIHDIGHGFGPNEGLLFQYTIQAANIIDPSVPIPFAGSGYVQEIVQYEP